MQSVCVPTRMASQKGLSAHQWNSRVESNTSSGVESSESLLLTMALCSSSNLEVDDNQKLEYQRYSKVVVALPPGVL